MAEDMINTAQELVRLAGDDRHFDDFIRLLKSLEITDRCHVKDWLDRIILNRTGSAATLRIDTYCAGKYEKLNAPEKAAQVLEKVLAIRIEGVAVGSFFRVCRKIENNKLADVFFSHNKKILLESTDFNILYELVYYFEERQDLVQLKWVLTRIFEYHHGSVPILQTLKNFYIRFSMLSELEKANEKIISLSTGSKQANQSNFPQLVESEKDLAQFLLEMHTEIEYKNRLLAVSDLARGIAHELGQPITNIRYTIQFYRRLLEKNLDQKTVAKVFDSILEETERMGALMARLAPLTSRHSVISRFDLLESIRKRIEQEQPRLQDLKITVVFSPSRSIWLEADPVRFDEIISNLLLNAIDSLSIDENNKNKRIDITILEQDKIIELTFSDNGPGIAVEHRKKIFEPLFSTKPPGKGEGLGLFIVWNLLAMQGGKIMIDEQYQPGARFILTLPKQPMMEAEKTL